MLIVESLENVEKFKNEKMYIHVIAIPRDSISNIWCMYIFPLNKCALQNEDYAKHTACSFFFSLRNTSLIFPMSLNSLWNMTLITLFITLLTRP